jgi:hypothetical protein
MMHNLPIDQKKLKDLVRLCMHYNVFPIFLPNCFFDQDPPEVATLLSDLVVESKNWLSAMTPEEIYSLIDSLPAGISQFIQSGRTSNQFPDQERVAIYYLVAELQRKYRPIQDAWNDDLSKSEVLKIYPELQDKFDKDGLLHIDEDLQLLDGGIVYRDHVLHYHQFLRRSFTANPNFDFTGRF